MKVGLLLIVVLLAGCASRPAPVQQAVTDKQKIQLLRDEAKKRKLKFHIFCDPVEDNKFGAEAFLEGFDHLIWDDEGAKPFWSTWSHESQADAAYALYFEIQQEPKPPMHHASSINYAKKCLPEIHN